MPALAGAAVASERQPQSDCLLHMMIIGTPVFRRLVLGAVLVVAATFVALNYWLVTDVHQEEFRNSQQRLVISARILAAELPAVPRTGLHAWTLAAAERANARITMIN